MGEIGYNSPLVTESSEDGDSRRRLFSPFDGSEVTFERTTPITSFRGCSEGLEELLDDEELECPEEGLLPLEGVSEEISLCREWVKLLRFPGEGAVRGMAMVLSFLTIRG